MLTLKSEASEVLTPLDSPSAAKELEHWKRVEFAFDMDREQPSNSRGNRNNRSRSTSTPNDTTGQHQGTLDITDAALLAHLAAITAGGGDINHPYGNLPPQGAYPSMGHPPGYFNNNFLHHNPAHQPQLPPISTLDFPWQGLMPQQHQHQQQQPHHPQARPSHYDPHRPSSSAGSDTFPYFDARYGSLPTSSAPNQAPETGQTTTRRRQPSSQPSVGGHTASSPEDPSMTDEKRRRNTAASARFRIKKKHKAITLERSVSDLTGRAEELEREVADLRRENGWLKEIVMLKGAQFAASNESHREALSKAAAMAVAGQSSSSVSGKGASTSGSGSRSTAQEPESDDEESEEEESEPEEVPDKKGKGKKPAKTRKK